MFAYKKVIFAINESNNLIFKTVMYNYDVKKIIDNIGKYEENYYPYSIIDENGNKYITYSTNNELKELLETCLVSNNQ